MLPLSLLKELIGSISPDAVLATSDELVTVLPH
jgi:hypothetical protein